MALAIVNVKQLNCKMTTHPDIPTVDQCNAAIRLGYVLNDQNKYLCRRAVSEITKVPWLWTQKTIPQVLEIPIVTAVRVAVENYEQMFKKEE